MAKPATPPAESPRTFEILHRAVVVKKGTAANPKPTVADIARVSTEADLVARIENVGRYGYRFYRYQAYDPAAPTQPAWSKDGPGDELEKFDLDLVTLTDGPRKLSEVTREVDARSAEIDRHIREYPWLSEKFNVEQYRPARPTKLFDVGTVQWPASEFFLPADIQELLSRHESGDFGSHGLYCATPISPEEEFLQDMIPQARRNALAIRRGLGVVKSMYPSITIRTALFGAGRYPRSLISY